MFYNFTQRSIATLLIVASLLVTNVYLFRLVTTRADGLTHIYILDVGQGDAILIRTADRETILIDGGPNGKILDHLAFILPPWDNDINLLVSTHADADHLAGLIPVLERYDVDQLWYTGAEKDTQTYRRFLELLDVMQIPRDTVHSGDKEIWENSNLEVIYPLADTLIKSLPSNDAAIVAEFTAGNFDMLLTADISDKIEKQLLQGGAIKPAEVLKVSHHGSRFSSTEEFIKAVNPEIAVVSVGASNTYNHPHPETLARYKQSAVPIYRTDLQGIIEIVTDGTYYKVLPARKLD